MNGKGIVSGGTRAMNEGSTSLLNRRLFFIGEENRKFKWGNCTKKV